MNIVFMMLAQFAFGQSAWVDTEIQLLHAIEDGQKSIKLDADIQLSKYLDIDGRTFTLDLNGHKLSRSLDSHGSAGHVIWAHNGSNLALTSSIDGGSIEGGKANNGGAIHIPHGNKVTANNVIFQNNSAADHAGAIWNNGTFEATNCTFKNNTANDVGAIYNAVTSDGAGNATLTGCTFTGNKGTAGAGALANALGNTVMTIDGCTITGNTASSNGAGIWNGGTLNMKGVVTVTDNKNGDVPSNVYLKSGKVITVKGALTGSCISVYMENTTGAFTSGYKTYNNGVAPKTFFTSDFPDVFNLELDGRGEACMTINYIERSWDATKKQIVSTKKTFTGAKIDYEATPKAGQYKLVTNAPDASPNEWFQMGGYSNSVAEFYVVHGNVKRETIVVMGKDVHLILCDGATLTLTGGLQVEDDRKLYIHSQSYGNSMGRLMVTNKYDKAAGIGSAQHNGDDKKVGILVIEGGHIEANGGKDAAGIGSCARSETDNNLCNTVTVYGGYVKAIGGENGAGIGGGAAYYGEGTDGGVFILYDGTVIAQGGENAAGVGGGGIYSFIFNSGGSGAEVSVHGGTLTATGGKNGAGIGGGRDCGGKNIQITGGTVTAYGGTNAAGIGGGSAGNGCEFEITGGTVMAYGGTNAAGIGGGEQGSGYIIRLYGGTVTAYGGQDGAGIGGGKEGGTGNVRIMAGNIIAKAGNEGESGTSAIGPGKDNREYSNLVIDFEMMVGAGSNGSVERIVYKDEKYWACRYQSYVEISPCTHPNFTYLINGTDVHGTHTLHCGHCQKYFAPEKHDFDGNGECNVCHLKGSTYTVTIYLPDANDDDTYTTDGVYKSYTYDMVAGTSFPLPGAPQDLQDMGFAGWLVITTEEIPSFSSYRASFEETLRLQPPGLTFTLENNISFVARYQDINIRFVDKWDNYEKIYNFDGKVASNVILDGRTFYKDGNWNTLCLPFAVTDGDEADGVTFSGTPLEGATVLTLDNATFENNTLTLNFEETAAMEPGKPYLIKWAIDTEHPTIYSPVFNNVTISNTYPDEKAVIAGIVSFKGLYAPLNIGEGGDQSILYLGADNTFRYPDGAVDINSMRAYFHANTSMGDVNGDGTINVTDVTVLVGYILGTEDENFIFVNADITRDGIISVTDVTALVDLILGGNSILKVVINGAEGLSFSGGGSGLARVSRK